MSSSCRRFKIGYALSSKKQRSLDRPSLLHLAAERGIDLVPIDPSRPLLAQGPFDCILHKLPGEDWNTQLRNFSSENPSVLVIDPPVAIELLHNRVSMLQVVSRLEIPLRCSLSLDVPNQIVLPDSSAALSDPSLLAGLEFPVIAKPLAADGSSKSHKLAIVFNPEGLLSLETESYPVVLQEFINHGGVVYKVYVAGDYVKCVKRKSLPDVSGASEGSVSVPFSQVSNSPMQEVSDEAVRVEGDDGTMPPVSFVEVVAHALCKEMGLHLFNFDLIRDVRDGNRYLVIDINYFPGYEKLPEYETVLTDFFCQIFVQMQGKETAELKEQ